MPIRFHLKLYETSINPKFYEFIHWNKEKDGILIKHFPGIDEFFRNANLSSTWSTFIRQMSKYGFSRQRVIQYEENNEWVLFKHKHFKWGDVDSLEKIRRTLGPQHRSKLNNEENDEIYDHNLIDTFLRWNIKAKPTFPIRLYFMLSLDKYKDYIDWNNENESGFKIRNTKTSFCIVIASGISCSIEAFHRQLCLYHFKRKRTDDNNHDWKVYLNENFRKNNFSAVLNLKRKIAAASSTVSTEEEMPSRSSCKSTRVKKRNNLFCSDDPDSADHLITSDNFPILSFLSLNDNEMQRKDRKVAESFLQDLESSFSKALDTFFTFNKNKLPSITIEYFHKN